MLGPLITFPASLRFARTLWSIMLASQILYVIASRIMNLPSHPPGTNFIIHLNATMAIASAVIALFLRFIWVGKSAEALRTNRDDGVALVQWRKGQILTFVLAEAVVMFGFSVIFVVPPARNAIPFFALGIALMLLFFPRDL